MSWLLNFSIISDRRSERADKRGKSTDRTIPRTRIRRNMTYIHITHKTMNNATIELFHFMIISHIRSCSMSNMVILIFKVLLTKFHNMHLITLVFRRDLSMYMYYVFVFSSFFDTDSWKSIFLLPSNNNCWWHFDGCCIFS